jgi:hypothetical protein
MSAVERPIVAQCLPDRAACAWEGIDHVREREKAPLRDLAPAVAVDRPNRCAAAIGDCEVRHNSRSQ